MFLPNPGVLAAGAGAPSRTYAEFEAHIVSLAGGEVAHWRNAYAWPSSGAVTTSVGTILDRGMVGSSWMTQFSGESGSTAVSRAVQHGMPNLTSVSDQLGSNRRIFLRFVLPPAVTEFFAVDRNGYLSSAATSGLSSRRRLTELIYWDGERAQRMQPYLGLGPEPYDW